VPRKKIKLVLCIKSNAVMLACFLDKQNASWEMEADQMALAMSRE
jgi:hypothetical protein